MELARMRLGLKELTLDVDGGLMHIHEVILAMFPPLKAGRVYYLLRLSESSYDLVEIESPETQGHTSAGKTVHPPTAV